MRQIEGNIVLYLVVPQAFRSTVVDHGPGDPGAWGTSSPGPFAISTERPLPRARATNVRFRR